MAVNVPQSDQEIVTGTVVGTIQKAADKWQIEVQPEGSQYTKKLWTKDPQLVANMGAQIGQHLAFVCGVSNWVNQQQQPVRSLWVNGVGHPTQAPIQPQVPSQPQYPYPTQQPVQPMQPQPVAPMAPVPTAEDDRERKIHRQTATKVAVQLLPYLDPDQKNFASLLEISERLVAYYDHGVHWAADPADAGGAPPPHGDSDIPF